MFKIFKHIFLKITIAYICEISRTISIPSKQHIFVIFLDHKHPLSYSDESTAPCFCGPRSKCMTNKCPCRENMQPCYDKCMCTNRECKNDVRKKFYTRKLIKDIS